MRCVAVSDIEPIIRWLKSTLADPIDEKWVRGTSTVEQRTLGALGGLTAAIIGASRSTLPEPIEQWLAAGPTPPEDILAGTKRLVQSRKTTVLAEIYSTLVQSDHRRHLGTYFTPTAEVDLMLSMWQRTQEMPDVVIDIGAGVGAFTEAADRRWQGIDIYATDVNPVTLGLLAVHLAVNGLTDEHADIEPNRTHLVLEDFTTWIGNRNNTVAGRRLILGNPPYTRAQLLPLEDRERLSSASSGLYGRRASLAIIMTALSLMNLQEEDGMCVLLPAQWLESDYARPLRENLWALTSRRVELHLVDSQMFKDARVDAVALMVGAANSGSPDFVVSKWPRGTRSVLSKQLACPPEWRSLFPDKPQQLPDITPTPSRPFSEVAHIRRGIATGANSFFILKDEDVQAWKLPWTAIYPLVHTLRNTKDPAVTTASSEVQNAHILNVTQTDRVSIPAVAAYILSGEQENLHERTLCARRQYWFDISHDFVVPDVIISPMTRHKFKILENESKATITNNLYGWNWKSGVSRSTRTQIVAWLRSKDGQESLAAVARRQGDGLLKMEPRALKELRVPFEVPEIPAGQGKVGD